MVAKAKTLDHRLLARRCVACGYDGTLLRGGQAAVCPRCECDLQRRPAKSYAEMEGLVGPPVALHLPLYEPQQPATLIHRWLAFFFISMIGLIALLYLTAAALNV